jgi:hypothetical protein
MPFSSIKFSAGGILMGRCPYDQLSDIESALEQIRTLEKIKEAKPGIFYFKSQGFLHFHLKEGKRWADIREGKNWGKPVDLPFKPSKKVLSDFLLEVRRRYSTVV